MAGLLKGISNSLGESWESLTGGFSFERESTKPDDEVIQVAHELMTRVEDGVEGLRYARNNEDMIASVAQASRANAAANVVALTTEPETVTPTPVEQAQLTEIQVKQMEAEVVAEAEAIASDSIYNTDGSINEDEARARAFAIAEQWEADHV